MIIQQPIPQFIELFDLFTHPEPTVYKPYSQKILNLAFKIGTHHEPWQQNEVFQKFLQDTREKMEWAWVNFSDFHTETIELFDRDWDYDWDKKWYEVCYRWSCGHFFHDFYDTKNNPIESFKYFSERDDYFEDLLYYGNSEEALYHSIHVPPNMPTHHFWWWLGKND